MDPLCEFPSREFYNGQLKPSPMLKNYSYPRLAHFWPKGTGHSVHTEDGVHAGLAGSAGSIGLTSLCLLSPGNGLPLVLCNVKGTEEWDGSKSAEDTIVNRREAEKVVSLSTIPLVYIQLLYLEAGIWCP